MQNLLLTWNVWNSGGGCLIASFDYAYEGKAHSIQLSDECLVLSNKSSKVYWEYESWEEQEKTHLCMLHFQSKFNLPESIQKFMSKELLDLVIEDIKTILINWEHKLNLIDSNSIICRFAEELAYWQDRMPGTLPGITKEEYDILDKYLTRCKEQR